MAEGRKSKTEGKEMKEARKDGSDEKKVEEVTERRWKK